MRSIPLQLVAFECEVPAMVLIALECVQVERVELAWRAVQEPCVFGDLLQQKGVGVIEQR